MNLLAKIIIGCWFGFMAYWLFKAKSVKPTQAVHRRFGGVWNLAGGFAYTFLFMSGMGLIRFYPFSLVIWPHWLWLAWGSTALVIVGLMVTLLARHTLANNWSADIEIKKGHELMTQGIYGFVRHPIYSGFLFMALGTCLFAGTVGGGLFLTLMLLVIRFKIKEEELLLTQHFPKEYPLYQQRVKALIPFVV